MSEAKYLAMAIPLEKQSLNQHIERLCKEFPEFRKFNAKFKGRYSIVNVDECLEYEPVSKSPAWLTWRVTILVRFDIASGIIKNVEASLQMSKRKKVKVSQSVIDKIKSFKKQ